MNLGDGKGSKAGGYVLSNQFPAGLRVLLVDDDRTCLMIMDKMLKACLYEVTKCNRAEVALSLLRENKNGYNIVISDVHMPDMDGFKLLEHIGLEMDLPVIMMSGDDEKNVVMKGVTHGACDYLIKPVRMEALRNIWQHVVRRRKNEWKDLEQSGTAEEGDRQSKQLEDADYSPSANEGSSKESKRKKDEEEETEEREDTSTLKKPRVVWTPELHQQFVAVVNQLGIDKAVPKKILELMNVPGLTRENVASHLQKFRLYLRRMNGVSQHPNNLPGSFIGTQAATYGPLSSLGGLDLQTLAATGQLPPQSLVTLQAAGLHRSTRMPLPIVEKRPFSFGNPELRFGEGQQQHLNSKPINLLQGIPTKMDRLANFRHSLHEGMNMQVNVYGSQVVQSVSLMMQMSQPQARGQLLNDNTGNHIGQLPSSIGQPIMSNAVSGRVLARNGLVETGRGKGFGPTSQSSSMLNFLPLNNSAELSGNAFPLGSAPRTSSLASAGGFQDEVTSDIKVSAGFVPSQEIFSNLHQQNYNDWKLQNAGFTFNSSQQPDSMQSDLDGGASVLVHTGFSSRQREGENRTAASVVKPIFSTGDTTEHVNVPSARQQLNTLFADNSVRVKAEGVPHTSCQTTLFPEQFGQGDLMSALPKQQQGGNAPAEDDFDFNSYP